MPDAVTVLEEAVEAGPDLEINLSTYRWSVRLFSIFKRLLRVRLNVYQDRNQIETGDIFLFNHFARFETFIPQYLIYRETGALCRSVASAEFFHEADTLGGYLRRVGAVPNDLPDLLPFLAAEILRGRKVIVFPEGGMVKDRRVLDHRGEFSIYSRSREIRRKHHSGAAVIALLLDSFKRQMRHELAEGNMRLLERWTERLELESIDKLVAACRRPTSIVPANITFYPIRVSDNALRQAADLLSRGLSPRMTEELLVEGNILFEDTDMDIRFGAPLTPGGEWSWWERRLLDRLSARFTEMSEFFGLSPHRRRWEERVLAGRIRRRIHRARDEYMRRMYSVVTVNLSHLASSMIVRLTRTGKERISTGLFYRGLYLAVKHAQLEVDIHLHESLKNPEEYGALPDGRCAGLDQFLQVKSAMGLLEATTDEIRFSPKIGEEHGFDEIRLENLIAVYANEVEPLGSVAESVLEGLDAAPDMAPDALARLRFDDEMIGHAWDRQRFSGPRYGELGAPETATETGEPFLLEPERPRGVGVVLAHGFLASPAEMRGVGERLAARGHTVLGVRLKGHGTSPWDLRERSWQDWLHSLERGYDMVAALRPRVAVVGFSTGGALTLCLAASRPPALAGIVAVAVPVKFRSRAMMFVPVVHGANRLMSWVSTFEGIMPFRTHETEHPHINYRNMPVRGLYELRRMADEVEARLPDVRCPIRIVQGDDDPVVDPRSATLIRDGVSSERADLLTVPSRRHGIVYENIGDTQESILEFVESLE